MLSLILALAIGQVPTAASIRVQSPWTAQTKTAYLGGQAKCSLSFLLKLNAPLPANQTFLATSSKQLVCYASGNPAVAMLYCQGTQHAVLGSFRPVVGRVHHVALSWDSAGVQTWYVDGLTVGSGTQATPTWNAPGPLVVGCSGAGADYQLQDVAIWHGYALSAAEVLALASGTATPATLATPATAWFPLGAQATAGAVDPTADAGFGGQFNAGTGTGSASYAPPLAWVSPFQVTDAHTGKSGQTVWLLAFRTGAVLTPPTLTVDGQTVPLVAGPVSGGWWSYALAPVTSTDASGNTTTTPRPPINPAQTVTIAAPAGWVAGAPALAVPVTNNVGRCEFAMPSNPGLGLGINMPGQSIVDGSSACPVGNWAVRLRAWNWGGAVVAATDPTGYPTQFVGTRTQLATPFATGAYPAGLWTVRYDAIDPATTVGLAAWGGSYPIYQPQLSSPGVNGKGVTSVYQSVPGGMTLRMAHPAGKPSFGNLQILPPGNQPSAIPYALEASIVKALSVGGGRGPACIRWMDSCADYGGGSNEVIPADLIADPARLSWAVGGKTTTVPLASLRPWTSGTVQTVYGDTPFPAGMNLWDGGILQCEAVTAQPHGLNTTAKATLTLNATVSVGGASRNLTVTSSPIFVTSPTSFYFAAGGGSGLLTIDAPVDLPAGASVSVNAQNGGMNIPPEFAAAACGTWAGCDLWRNIPAPANDDLVAEYARRDLANLPAGHRVILEYSNETWDYGLAFTQAWYTVAMGQLMRSPGGSQGYTIRRALECGAIYKRVFGAAGRGSDVVTLLAGQFGSMDYLSTLAVTYYQQTGQAFDGMAMAPYADFPSRWSGAVAGWSTAAKLDTFRHYLMADPAWGNALADFTAGVRRYEAAVGHRIGRYGYEGDLELIPNTAGYEWAYHPDVYDTERCLYASLDRAGMDVLAFFTLYGGPTTAGTEWGLYSRQGEIAGTGDGTDGRPVNVITPGMTTPGAVSPRGKAWQDWQRDHSIAPAPTPVPAPPAGKRVRKAA